jgi:DnaJ-class molecular chaperone
MRRIWNRLTNLNEERSIWLLQEELGKELILMHRKAQYRVKIPKTINKKVSIRLRGLGKKRFKQTGDLLLHVWLNKGTDVRRTLWLSENAILQGTEKIIWVDKKRIQVVIPPYSHQGLVLRLKGLGKEVDCRLGPPLLDKNRGDLYIKLFGYPDTVTPQYGSFENLGTDDMAHEGWIYRKIDEVTQKIGSPPFRMH